MQTTVADLLQHVETGKKVSLDSVMPQVYDELHRLAASYMRRERNSHTLQPTALVNETYLRLIGQHSVDFANRAQLLGVAAQMMRRILKTHEEKRATDKRGGDKTILCLDDSPEPSAAPALFFGEVDELLDRMAELDARQAKVAELRIFGGLTTEETAEFLDISPATAHRDWVSGRLWLTSELQSKPAS
jgi:RNA polymerase sigma-70 factor (ECF subfamily)